MARTRACDYCGSDIEPGTGTMFVRINGATVHYCSSKCEKNADLGREARNLEWTESGGDREDTAPDAADSVEDTQEPDEESVAEENVAEPDTDDVADSADVAEADESDESEPTEEAADEEETEEAADEEETEEAEA